MLGLLQRVLVFLGFLSFFCFLIRKYASNFLYKFCFLKVNLCEMRYFKTIIFTVVRNGFEVLNSKQTVTMADYTFNYTVFSLSTAGRLTSVWIVLETWALRDGFRCLLLAALEEPFSFCLLPRAQGQACLGALVTCKDRQHLQLRSEASVRSRPHQPGSPPWSCPGTAVPTVADWPSFLIWCLVLFHKLLPTQKTGAAGGHGLGVLERWRANAEEWKQGQAWVGRTLSLPPAQPFCSPTWLLCGYSS